MKSLLALATALSMTATAALAAPGYTQITDAEAFSSLVVGKPLLRNRSSFTILANGSIEGQYNGREIVGTWEWVGDAFCRTLTSPRRGFSCQRITSNGESARFAPYPRNQSDLVQEAIARNR